MTDQQRAEDVIRKVQGSLCRSWSRTVDGEPIEVLEAVAPEGMTWSCCAGTHILLYAEEPDWPLSRLWRSLLQDVEQGVEPCDDPNCDVCRPLDD